MFRASLDLEPFFSADCRSKRNGQREFLGTGHGGDKKPQEKPGSGSGDPLLEGRYPLSWNEGIHGDQSWIFA
jgi:hypothetical protein